MSQWMRKLPLFRQAFVHLSITVARSGIPLVKKDSNLWVWPSIAAPTVVYWYMMWIMSKASKHSRAGVMNFWCRPVHGIPPTSHLLFLAIKWIWKMAHGWFFTRWDDSLDNQGTSKTCSRLVSIQRKYPPLWNIRQRSNQCWASVSGNCKKCFETRSWRWFVLLFIISLIAMSGTVISRSPFDSMLLLPVRVPVVAVSNKAFANILCSWPPHLLHRPYRFRGTSFAVAHFIVLS